MHYSTAQRGFSLFIVLIVMLVIAFMVVAGVQSMNTEMRISSNDADRKLAMSVAETALRAGEESITTYTNATPFDVACTGGRCVPAGGVAPSPVGVTEKLTIMPNQRLGNCDDCDKAAWERAGIFDAGGNSVEVAVTGDYARNPRYIVEYLNVSPQNRYYFRVTARAWGKSPNTVVTVQSYVAASYNAR